MNPQISRIALQPHSLENKMSHPGNSMSILKVKSISSQHLYYLLIFKNKKKNFIIVNFYLLQFGLTNKYIEQHLKFVSNTKLRFQ